MVMRIVLSLILICLAGVSGYYLYYHQEAVCSVCLRTMHNVTTYRLTTSDGEVLQLCCPRCGLYLQKKRDDVVRREVADFNSGTFLAAEKAYYVEGSSVHLCCSGADLQKDQAGVSYERSWDRCLPSLFAFETEEEAKQFIQRQGGILKSYAELIVEVGGLK